MQRLSSFIKRFVAPWIVVFTIVGYPLVTAISSIFDLPNRPMSIIARGIVLALTLACIFFIRQNMPKRENFAFWLSWWIFWCAYLIRLLVDHYLNSGALALPTAEYFIFIFGVCLLPSMVAVYIQTRTVTAKIFDKLIWIAAIGLLLNLNHIFSTTIELESLDTIRAESEVLNPITIGHIGSTILLLVFWRLTRGGSASLAKNLGQLAAVAVAVTAIITSGSKGPLLALVLAILFYALLLPRRFLSGKVMFYMITFGFAAVILLQSNPDLFLFSRISEGIFNDGIRLQLLSDSIDLILKHPILGSGIEPLGVYPHNLLVESFVLFGITTGIPFLFMIASTFWKCRVIARQRPEDFWVCLLFAQYFFGAMVSGSLYTSAALYTMMVLVVAMDSVRLSSKFATPIKIPAPSTAV